MSKSINVALIGNPNTGKTSIFNELTGLNQKVGNYPGITVEKKEGICKLSRGLKAHIIDLPGTYSLNTTSLDESVVVELLMNKKDKDYPDVAVLISDVENLKRNLLLYTQIKDLKIPVILAINMADRMQRKGIKIDVAQLEKDLDTRIALISARNKTGIETLKEFIANYQSLSSNPVVDTARIAPEYFDRLKRTFPNEDQYKLWLVITQDTNFGEVEKKPLKEEAGFGILSDSELKRLQHKETILRYQFINNALKQSYEVDLYAAKGLRATVDRILMHKVFGYIIFFLILLLIFQAIYDWSSYPMDFIDEQFAALSQWVKITLPSGVFTDLIAEGILAGIAGIVIFIPQIAFLFFFIAILEESGYMSRVVFLMDRLMRPFGLSGKSIVPLISGAACAIPAIMATRNITNWKERLITILVTPFVTCSARLPVYLIIIALVIPAGTFLGFSYQALTLLILYFMGFGAALFSAKILHHILKLKNRQFFVMEMPSYKVPRIKDVLFTAVEKTKSFVYGAGKIILAIAIVLWFLGSNGYREEFRDAEQLVTERINAEGFSMQSRQYIDSQLADIEQGEQYSQISNIQESARQQEIASFRLEHSYIGIMGKFIEPMVQPLGYDWKIGVAILTSFAAREVFVSTLSTIYSVGSEEEDTIKHRMAMEVNVRNKKPLFNLASGISLLLFYAFAMQCMSTLAIVKKETNSWKWPMMQLVGMTLFAYLIALLAYQILQ
ncbi:MAG: ferrous iron transport protein B [Flavobacteriaceae bacterium]|nr:ferrous iron transport protein B [Flavobacteriaceae bacterium]